MNAILAATLVIAAVGAVAALALAIADKYLSVKEDPRIGLITAALPGANCGGCGFAGCDGYARALVAGDAANGACAPGGAAASAEIAKILGVAAAATERRRQRFSRNAGSLSRSVTSVPRKSGNAPI